MTMQTRIDGGGLTFNWGEVSETDGNTASELYELALNAGQRAFDALSQDRLRPEAKRGATSVKIHATDLEQLYANCDVTYCFRLAEVCGERKGFRVSASAEWPPWSNVMIDWSCRGKGKGGGKGKGKGGGKG